MKTVCAWCGAVIKDGPELDVSQGMCGKCKKEHFPFTLPKAGIMDCVHCRYAGKDSDGVPDSCDMLDGEACVREDRRSGWSGK